MSNRLILIITGVVVLTLIGISSPRLFESGGAAHKQQPEEGIAVSGDARDATLGARDTKRTVSSRISNFLSEKSAAPEVQTADTEGGGESPSSAKADEGLRAYGNTLASVLLAHGKGGRERAEVLYAFAKSPEDEVTQADFTEVAEQYDALAETLSRIVEPPSAIASHQAIIEGYRKLGSAIRTLIKKGSDGEPLTEQLNAYNEASIRASDSIIDIAFFFQEQGVLFSASEPGSVFTLLP